MARPRNEKLKSEIRAARAAGASIEELMASFTLSRNTIFYHLKNGDGDGREHYSEEDRRRIAGMNDAELREEAKRLGKTFIALQRVAYRTRKRLSEESGAARLKAIEARGYVDLFQESELKLVGLSSEAVALAGRRLLAFGLKLAPPNRLESLKGDRYCTMSLAFEKALILNTVETLKASASKIKQSWRAK